jgi:dynein heavy chain
VSGLLIRPPPVPGCRHWDQIRDEIQWEFDQESENFTLEQIVELGMDQHVEKIGEISASATKELAIELV